MLKTIIDFEIFEDFIQKQPKSIPHGSVQENRLWNSFWNYLKSESDLVITNYNNKNNIFLSNMTTGRRGTHCRLEEKFKKPNKFLFPKNTNIKSIFFIDEPSIIGRKNYRRKNGFIFGFKEDYMSIWKNISFFEKPRVLPVRKSAKVTFHSWEQLSDFIVSFSDLIIVDNYMFDKTSWDYNLFKIIEEFSKKTSIKFNLFLISFMDDNKLTKNYIKELYNDISNKLKEKNINCDLSIALAYREIKEHDRGIFTNYLRIKSGDSFIYFNKNGEIITKGTDIDFYPLTEKYNENASEAALRDIKKIVNTIFNNPFKKETRLVGNLKNKLLDL